MKSCNKILIQKREQRNKWNNMNNTVDLNPTILIMMLDTWTGRPGVLQFMGSQRVGKAAGTNSTES